MDVSTGLTILGGAIGSAKVVEKILGPTADYLGNGLKGWTECRVNNVAKIFEKAQKKLGEKINEEGSVHPKVLKEILSEGSFYDDELMVEYFGGVLASSRSGISRDDRGASFIALIGRLTTYQIRSHYIFYSILKKLFDGRTDVTVMSAKQIHKLTVFISHHSYNLAMEFGEGENPSLISSSVMSGLARENLIQNDFEVIGGEKTAYCGGDGIVFIPTDLGVELFLWVNGKNDIPVTEFLNTKYQFSFDTQIQIPEGKSVDSFLRKAKERMEMLKPSF